jgi:hypothetical protein
MHSTTCGGAEWTSPPWELAATQAMPRLVPLTRRSGSRFFQARGT